MVEVTTEHIVWTIVGYLPPEGGIADRSSHRRPKGRVVMQDYPRAAVFTAQKLGTEP
jgi:hypothetical protein